MSELQVESEKPKTERPAPADGPMKQGKITLYLLIVCVLIAGAGFLLKRHAKTVKQTAEKKDRVFEGLASDQIKGVKIVGSERQFEFVREGGQWLIQKPLHVRADKGEVDNLLYAIEFLERKRKITPQELSESKVTLADYGLEKPRFTLKISTDQKEHTIEVGHENRQSDGVYVRIDSGGSVWLVGKTLVEKLEQPLDQWRNRKVLELDDVQVARIEIKTPKRAIEFARQNDTWRIVQPLNARASSHAVESMLDALASLRAEKFLSEEGADLKKYKLDEPRSEITLKTDKGGDPGQTLLVGAPAGEQLSSVVRKGSSSIVAVSAKVIAMLDASLNDLRDNQLLHIDKRDIAAAEIRRDNQLIRVEKADSGWKIIAPKQAAADRDLVDQFLGKFTGLKIQEFTTDVLTEVEKYGLGDGATSVRLLGKPVEKGKDAPVLANVRIGERDPKKPFRYVKRDDESSVYGVNEEEARFVPSSVLDLRDRIFLTLAKDAVREVRLRSARKETAVMRTDKGDWVSEGPVDRPAVDKIVADLSRMTAIRLVSEGEEMPGAKYGFNRPMGELTVIEKNGDEKISHEIIVGAKMDGKTYLYYRNKELLAEIPVIVAEELTTPLLKK
jgi:uncharacterized protein DUF4340